MYVGSVSNHGNCHGSTSSRESAQAVDFNRPNMSAYSDLAVKLL